MVLVQRRQMQKADAIPQLYSALLDPQVSFVSREAQERRDL